MNNLVSANFYRVSDVMRLTGTGKSKAYQIIRQLNGELEKAGYLTIPGKVSRAYFNERLFYSPAHCEA